MSRSFTERLEAYYSAASAYAEQQDRAIMGQVRLVGAALIMILVMVMVLTEVWEAIDPSTDADGNYDGTWGPIYEALEGTGTAALTLLVVGTLVVAAAAILRTFNGGFGSR